MSNMNLINPQMAEPILQQYFDLWQFFPKNNSYSAYGEYTQCPYRYYRCKVLKDVPKQIMGAEQQAGIVMHEDAEAFVKGTKKIPEGYTNGEFIGGVISNLRRFAGQTDATLEAEPAVAFDRYFNPIRGANEQAIMFAKDTWWRVKIDLRLRLPSGVTFIGDWKTGAPKVTGRFNKIEEYQDQMADYALAELLDNPNANVVRTSLVWTTAEKLFPVTVHSRATVALKQIDIMRKTIDIAMATRDGNFPHNPSGLCNGYCPVTNCMHYKEKKK